MDADAVTIEVWRNAPAPPDEYQLKDKGGVIIDLSGRTMTMDVRRYPGQPGAALIALNLVEDSANGLRFVDDAQGLFKLQISQPVIQAAYDTVRAENAMRAGQAAELAYDIRILDADGFAWVAMEGDFIIHPGVTL